MFHADPNDSTSIVKALHRAVWVNEELHFLNPNINGLDAYNIRSMERWKNFIESVC